MDGMLSQEEINALLNGANMPSADPAPTAAAFEPSETLSDAEKDAIGEISNISMGTAATTLSALINQKVNITTPKVTYSTWENLMAEVQVPCVCIQIYYTSGLEGNNILILKEEDVKTITDLMMGGDGNGITGELTDLHLSAIGEAMNQMMGSASTSMSSMLNKKIDISPPTASLVKLTEVINATDIADFLTGDFVKVTFDLEIDNLIKSEIMQMYSFDFARNIYQQFMNMTSEQEAPTPKPASAPEQKQAPVQPEPVRETKRQEEQGMFAQQPYAYPNGMYAPQTPSAPYQAAPVQNVNIAPVQFQPFTEMNNPLLRTENIDLLLDVPLEVTAELGRTSKSIKEVLDFAPGTIIELNRLAGEPVDVLVNGKYVAKGEVVVIEETFGIKVTEVIK
ncbi:MAG: flagellar motor switch phosphatase FliY [Lachnospiraceae bacterium]|nr:flagellar motor switch phosphatase FliY [Lachnospiraceae bacterium]